MDRTHSVTHGCVWSLHADGGGAWLYPLRTWLASPTFRIQVHRGLRAYGLHDDLDWAGCLPGAHFITPLIQNTEDC